MLRHAANFFRVIEAAALLFCASAIHAASVENITSGPYPVGSTNFEVSDLPLADMERRLIGSYSSTADIYVADLLQCPNDCPAIDVDMPNNSSLFGRHAGKKVHFVTYILYPTTDDNTRPDYVFPYTNTGDHTFPHMQRSGEAPLIRDPHARYPLIVYSHGYNAHGLWDLGHMKLLASQGYIVAALQHGDGRNSFQGCYGERPLAITRFLDYLLAHPVFGPAIDSARIGMSGTSMGGYTTLAVVGGGCFGSSLVPTDKRFRAAFGLVPLVGSNYSAFPFGASYDALAGVTCPFYAVYAQNDTSVPKATVEAALPKIQKTCAGVIITGETHSLSNKAYEEGQTYEILFFNAWLRDDKAAMTSIYGDMHVEGGVNDKLTYLHVVNALATDEDAAFGFCPVSSRLGVRISGSKILVDFPVVEDGSIRYDLMGSQDLRVWQCLRTTEVAANTSNVPDLTLPSGFRWRVVEVDGGMDALATPLFMSVRLSQ